MAIATGRLNFIDLFCGCGGFTLGLLRAGFRCLAAMDNDPIAIETLSANRTKVKFAKCVDLTRFGPAQLDRVLGGAHVHVVVGGPPCQGFSTARQVDGSNHGRRLTKDSRRYLYQDFLKYVDFFQPLVFIMENVPGMRSAAGGEYFTRVQQEARMLGRAKGEPGYRVHTQLEDATGCGVPQKRRRQLIVGVRNDLPTHFPANLRLPPTPTRGPEQNAAPKQRHHLRSDGLRLGVAIGDLPRLRAGEGEHSTEYDLRRRAAHLRRYGAEACDYLMRVLEVERAPQLMNHVARPHSKRDLGDFRKLREGESSAVAMARGVKFDFPYDKSSFKDRYTRQSNSKPCSTIVAHLSKDGLMFIHPTQARSLTPREAARVQSFPDWFVFPRARTHAFRLIGNAVPPLVGEAIGAAIGAFLGASAGVVTVRTATRERGPRLPRGGAAPDTPKHIAEALAGPLRRAVPLDRGALRRLSQAELLAAWHSALALLPHLHPENARDHGTTTLVGPSNPDLPDDLARVLGRCHARSGWPVALTALGREAWRRVGTAQIPEASLYHPPASITHPSIQSRRNVRT